MSKDIKVALVVGSRSETGKMFEFLSGLCNVTVFKFLDEAAPSHASSILFEHIDAMPGYLRDLEKYLTGFDIIVALEANQISTFQALKIARTLGIPFSVFDSGYQAEQWIAFENVRRMRQEILQQSDRVISISDHIPRLANPQEWTFNRTQRQKFREYLNWSAGTYVTVIDSPIEEKILSDFVLESHPGLLVFHGNGPDADSLKRKCVDRGLVGRVCFLHQDSRPFQRDLMMAADAYIYVERAQFEVPWFLWGAYLSGVDVQWKGQDRFVFEPAVGPRQTLSGNRVKAYENRFERTEILKLLGIEERITLGAEESREGSLGEKAFRQGDYETAIEHLSASLSEGKSQVRSLVLLGQISLRTHSYEEAIRYFRRAFRYNPQDHDALLGIGMVFESSRMYDEAMRWYGKCIFEYALDAAKPCLLRVCLKAKNQEVAIEYLEQLLEQQPTDQATLISLGKLYQSAGRIEHGAGLIRVGLASSS